MSDQPVFLVGVTVLCCAPDCGHVEWAEDARKAHDAMGQHHYLLHREAL